MKDLKKYMTEGLLQVTILLSLVGVRVDFDSYLPPIREIILGSSSAYSQIPFHSLRDTAGGASLHPKCPQLHLGSYVAAAVARRRLPEVRALGGAPVPSTELHAWLLLAAEAPGAAAQDLLPGGAAESSSSFESPSELQEELPPEGRDCAKEQQDVETGADREVFEYSYLHEENNSTLEQDGEKLQQEDSGEQNVPGNNVDYHASENTKPCTERNRNSADSSLLLEEVIHLLAETGNELEDMNENTASSIQPTSEISQSNSMREMWQDILSLPDLQEISLEDIQPVDSNNSDLNPSSHFRVNLTQAISQDVSLHEAMLRSDPTLRRNSEMINFPREEISVQLNSSTTPEAFLNETNVTGLFPYIDNSIRNLTNQDLLSGFDENIFDEINLMSLAMEEGFDPMEVSQLFEEPDSDSGLSLNSSHSPTFSNTSDSLSTSTGEEEGAVGYSSDAESVLYDHLKGAVGEPLLEHNKRCLDYQADPNVYGKPSFAQVRHNHTYNLMPKQLKPSPEHHHSQSAEASKLDNRCISDASKIFSRDERRAKALRLPFSVEEIVGMPVDVFNSLLTKYYLTEAQISVVRDIRRRGKNKVAAQNCRKRKLDAILNLENDVCQLQAQKASLLKEKAQRGKSVSQMKEKLSALYRDVFSRLRDEQGRPVNPSQYALRCHSDGSILVVPRGLFKSEHTKENQKEKKQK
ncbi:nuclear factor erythroid 2-related factor 3 [Rhinatrema bivittatum]|uniref:nuclear factor erythroid 2-related factor 3 n=1 Tax=Rhinatrema bivittatum TaxID=194408 RepID=UPI00112A9DD2|nr:nuclear factor erythroid 2-related factor 3 [Rhinatrema bivittatum]